MVSSRKDRILAACNWTIVGVATIWSVYVFSAIFSVPVSTQVPLVQLSAKDLPALSVLTSPPRVEMRTSNSGMPPAAAIAAGVQSQPGTATSAHRPSITNPAFLGNAPYAVAPAVPIPALNPAVLPPGVGKDF